MFFRYVVIAGNYQAIRQWYLALCFNRFFYMLRFLLSIINRRLIVSEQNIPPSIGWGHYAVKTLKKLLKIIFCNNIFNFRMLTSNSLHLIVTFAAYFMCGILHAEFKFEEYIANNAEDFIKDISAEFPPSKEEEYEKAKKDLAANFKAKKWAKGLNSAKTILTYPIKEPDTLIDVAIFCYNAYKNIKKANYEYLRIVQYAAFFAYKNAKSNLQKAQALLLYCKDNYAPMALEEANKLYPLKKLREEDHRFKNINRLKYRNHSLEESPQGAILHLNFSHDLQIAEPENYIEVSPNADGFIHADGKTITISGFQSGVEYKVKLRPGIKSIFDEKINEGTNVSFFVNDLKPVISFPSNTYIYPKQEKIHIPVRTINIDAAKATLYRIPDRDIVHHLGSLMERAYHLNATEKLFSTIIDFNGKSKPNQTITKNLELSKAMPELKPGVYVLSVKQEGALEYKDETQDQWFIVTDIGLSTFKSEKSLVVQARAFSNALPLRNVQLELVSADNDILGTATTDTDGFAEFSKELLGGKAGKRPVAIFAKSEKLGFSFLSLKFAGFDFSDRGAKGRVIKNDYDAMIFCERGIYRPGERTNIITILRNGQGKESPVAPLIFVVKTPGGRELKRETIEGDELGVYHLEYKIPDDCTTGMWQVEVFVDPTRAPIGDTEFRVDDFSPNKMELSLTTYNKSADPGSMQKCTLNAYYLYGAPVDERKAILEARITPDPVPFPKWKEYHFGLDDDKFVTQIITGTESLITEGKTELTVNLPSDINCSQALRVDLMARLADTPNSQQATIAVNMLTQPYIVGIREKETGSSQNIELEIIAVDNDGKLVSVDDLEYTFFESEARYQWSKDNRSNWSYQRIFQDKPIEKSKISTKADSPVSLSVDHKKGPNYAIEIKKKDGSKIAKYRLGKSYRTNKDSPEILKMISETKAVKLGETAVFKVNAPFDGEATVVTGLNSIRTIDTVHLSKGWNIIRVPTNESWGSGAYVLISLVRPLNKKLTEIQPKRIVGLQWVQIDHEDRVLDIKLDLPKQVKPQSQLKIPVQISNLRNEKARLVLAIIDEGVIGLTNFAVPDLIKYFFGQRELGFEMRDVYGHIIDPLDADLIDMRSGGDSLMLRRGAFVPRLNDKVLSLFDDNVHLDQDGKAEVQMDIPGFFGKLKVYAVAIAKNKMGSQSDAVTVKDNLIVDPYLPNFLTVGDENRFNVRLENTTDEAIEFEISINLGDAFKENARKEKIKLSPKEQKNFWVELNAEQIGEGTVNIEASGESVNYRYATSVEVRPSYQPIILSTMQEIKPNQEISLSKEDILSGLSATKAEAELFVSNQGPWNFGKIQKWLLNYPFGCTQQIISKGFAAIFALKQCKKDDEVRRIELQRICNQVIELLNERQSSSGSWGMWSRESNDFKITSYAIEMLTYAQECGLVVPKTMLENALQFAKNKINSMDWQIKQDRQKADDIAGFVKLCAQTKKIDTATLRYCFDEYFEKCDTVVSKALFIASVASVQDLSRVKRGIKAIEVAIGKGVALDDAAQIVAYLTPFKEIDIIAQQLQILNEILNKGIGGDVTKLNTQALAMILKANSESIRLSSSELNISINDSSLSAASNITHTLKPLENINVKNNGNGSIWLFINAYGIPKEVGPILEKGIKCHRTFYRIDGTKVDPHNVILGERIVVVIEGEMDEQENESYLMLSEWLPAGFSHANSVPNYDWLKGITDNAMVQKRHDRYLASWKHPAKSTAFKIAYEIIPTHTGHFQYPGTHIENMLNPSQYASYTPGAVIIHKEQHKKKEVVGL